MESDNLDLAVRIQNIMRGELKARKNPDGKLWVDGISAAAKRITDYVEGLD